MELRSLERAWRAGWMRAIAAMLPGPRTTPVPDWSGRGYRVLYVRYERIGDMIMSTSMIRALATSHPTITLDVVATEANAPVLIGNPYVSRVHVLERGQVGFARLLSSVAGGRYDVVVDGRVNKPAVFVSTPLVMLATRAPYRVGSGGGAGDLIYNVRTRPYDRFDFDTHYVDASAHLAAPFGVDVAAFDWRPELFLTADERACAESYWSSRGRRRLLVNLSASEPRRRWPDERFVEVLRDARRREPGLTMSVIGLPGESQSVREVAAAIDAKPVMTPRLRDALAMVGTADLVLTPDTSISHAASAFRKPAVVLLKQEHVQYAPYRLAGETVLWRGDTINELPVARVRAAVLRLLTTSSA